MIYGIDISKHQGEVNWDALEAEYKAGNIGFVIARAGYGSGTVDLQWQRNYYQASKRGIPIGAYWYAYWGKGNPVQEAEAFLATVDGCVLSMGIWYDVEYEPNILNLSKAQRTDKVLQGLDRLAKSGRYVGLYASTDMINNRLDWQRLKGYDVWVAQYGSKCTCKLPYGIWQYSSKNALGIAGYGGHLDCNRAYKDYPEIVKDKLRGEPCETALPMVKDPEPRPAAQTIKIDTASRGDLITLIDKAVELGIDVQGELCIGQMTAGDYRTFADLCETLGLTIKEV